MCLKYTIPTANPYYIGYYENVKDNIVAAIYGVSSGEVAYFFKIIKIILASHFILCYNNNMTNEYFVIKQHKFLGNITYEIVKNKKYGSREEADKICEACRTLNSSKDDKFYVIFAPTPEDFRIKNSNGEGKQLSLPF